MSAIALNAAMSGSILAVPDACFVMIMALPFGSTPALPTDQATLPTGPGLPYASLRLAYRLANAVSSVDLRTRIFVSLTTPLVVNQEKIMTDIADKPRKLEGTVGGSAYIKPAQMDWKPTRFERFQSRYFMKMLRRAR